MRPGKPLIWGKIGKTPLLGLPGNPVSTAVCALVFLAPAISKLGGGTYQQQLFSATITSIFLKMTNGRTICVPAWKVVMMA